MQWAHDAGRSCWQDSWGSLQQQAQSDSPTLCRSASSWRSSQTSPSTPTTSVPREGVRTLPAPLLCSVCSAVYIKSRDLYIARGSHWSRLGPFYLTLAAVPLVMADLTRHVLQGESARVGVKVSSSPQNRAFYR
jgi:hypothetical protein